VPEKTTVTENSTVESEVKKINIMPLPCHVRRAFVRTPQVGKPDSITAIQMFDHFPPYLSFPVSARRLNRRGLGPSFCQGDRRKQHNLNYVPAFSIQQSVSFFAGSARRVLAWCTAFVEVCVELASVASSYKDACIVLSWLYFFICVLCVLFKYIICLNLQIHSCVCILCTHAFTVTVHTYG
jgi:hypothetical protein